MTLGGSMIDTPDLVALIELAALNRRIHILEGFETVFDALDEILRIILMAMTVDIGTQPGKQLTEITLADLVIEIPNILVDLLPQLRGDQISQGVGGEIPDRAAGPMDILQHPFCIIGRRNAQIFLHFCVP